MYTKCVLIQPASIEKELSSFSIDSALTVVDQDFPLNFKKVRRVSGETPYKMCTDRSSYCSQSRFSHELDKSYRC